MTIDTTKLRELAQKATPGPWNCELARAIEREILGGGE